MALIFILIAGILTMWIPQRSALSAFQVALFAYAAVRILSRRSEEPPRPSMPAVLLGVLCLWSFTQAALGLSADPETSFETGLDHLTALTVFLLAIYDDSGREMQVNYLRVWCYFGAALAAISTFTALTSPPGVIFWTFNANNGIPTLGPFVYKNQYATFVEAILPIALYGAIRETTRRPLYILAASVLIGSVVAGGSRMGTFLCLVELFVVPAVALAQKKIDPSSYFRIAGTSVAAVGFITLAAGCQTIWARLQETNPYALRLDLVRSSLSMIQARPWTGFGAGTWPIVYPAFARFDDGTFVNQAHNDWLQWAVELGAPGFTIMLTVCALAVRPALRSIWGIGLLGVFIHASIDYPFRQRPALAAFFFALLGLLFRTEHLTGSFSKTNLRRT